MTSDETDDHRVDDGDGEEDLDDPDDRLGEPDTEPLEDEIEGRDEGVRTTTVEEVDQRIVDLLSWILDTETRAKIYVHLLANPGSTSEEVARGTGLYPSTVREALAELHDEDRVTREKRESEGAGNNPYEYTAIQPSELVGGVVDQVQQELNTIFTLDRVVDRPAEAEPEFGDDVEPVTITVADTEPPRPGEADDDADGSVDDATEPDDDDEESEAGDE